MKELAEFIKAGLEAESSPTLFHPDELARMAIAGRKQSELSSDQPLTVDLKQLREESRVIVGIHEIYGKLFDELGVDWVLGNPARRVQSAMTIKHLVGRRQWAFLLKKSMRSLLPAFILPGTVALPCTLAGNHPQ